MNKFYGTTILSVRKNNLVALGGDGQVTLGNISIKNNACKIRKIYKNKILVGFAGKTSDSFTLLNLFESKIKKYQGDLMRASVELSKEWRTDKILKQLEAMLLVTNIFLTLIITGNGDILEPNNGIGAIGSGSIFAQSAAIALLENTNLLPIDIVKKSLNIAGELCIYTNLYHTIKTLN